MDRKVIFVSSFNVYFMGHTDYTKKYNDKNEKDLNWIKFRAGLTKGYCLKSLINQTNQNFIAYFKCREEHIDYIKKLIGELPQNIKFCSINDCDIQIKALSTTNDLYIVRVDSDDMWKLDMVDRLYQYNHKPETEILINQWCYNYDICGKRLARFFYPSPQSYVLIYKGEEYLKGKRHRLKGGHMGAINLAHEIIPGINYMDTIHGTNICSKFDSNTWQQFKEFHDLEEKKNILKQFGITI